MLQTTMIDQEKNITLLEFESEGKHYLLSEQENTQEEIRNSEDQTYFEKSEQF